MSDKIEKWKVLESEYVIQRPWLTARRERVQLPNGQIHPEYYVLEYPTWANVIAITDEGKYVMVEQYRHGSGEINMELCAGCVEPGEDPMDGAKRELAEETGYTGGEWTLLSVLSPNPATSNNKNYCYLARGVRKTEGQHLDRTEDIAVRLLTEEELRTMLQHDQIKQALMAAPLWKYFATLHSAAGTPGSEK